MNTKDIAYWIIIIVIICLAIYLIYYINTESYQCINNSYKYTVNLMEKSNNANVTCLCTAVSDRGVNSIRLTREGLQYEQSSLPSLSEIEKIK